MKDFAAIKGPKILVHGGGRRATKVAAALGIETKMVDGRRITDAEMLEVVTMVYGGLVNKHVVAGLQSLGVLVLSGLAGFVFFGIMRHAFNRFLEQQVADLDGTFAVEYNRELSLGTRDDLRQFWSLTRPVLAGLLRTRWRDLPVFTWGALRRLQRDVARTTGVTAGK